MSTKTQAKPSRSRVPREQCRHKGFFRFTWTLYIISCVLLPLLAFYTYKIYTSSEIGVPTVDSEAWWGPYPIDMKQDNSSRPYTVEFPEVIVNDLKERLLHRPPFAPPLEDAGFQYGFNTVYLTRILDYWLNSYNFRERAHFLNKYNHFVTTIQGLDIHYMHVLPNPDPNVVVVPILMVHSWPTSFRDFYEIVPLLTTQQPDRNFVFEVIVPSLPGFGFSKAPTRPGMGPTAIAAVLNNLMKRIGHQQYYVHGGDFGGSIASIMATVFPNNVKGLHASMPVTMWTPYGALCRFVGYLWGSLIVEPELHDRLYPLDSKVKNILKETGYSHIQATKPDTVGIALSESPAGLAAYILEKFSSWTNLEYEKASDGGLLAKYSLTHLLDNVMIYWVTNSITTSMRSYVGYHMEMYRIDQVPTAVPTWGIKFKNEIYFTPDIILKMKYTNYLQSTIVEDGGHFPALELPQILAKDIFDAVTAFRKFAIEFNTESKESQPPQKKPEAKKSATVYEFTVKDIKGNEVSLEKYKGKVLIIVNVASQCGFTDTHYTQLNTLYDLYEKKGLRILAFPCNQFGGQEPGTLEEIFQFSQKRNVKFDMFEKIEVNGENTHPLWQFLKESQGGTMGDFIKWNFSKFIIDRQGVPVARFAPSVNPIELEPFLTKYW